MNKGSLESENFFSKGRDRKYFRAYMLQLLISAIVTQILLIDNFVQKKKEETCAYELAFKKWL